MEDHLGYGTGRGPVAMNYLKGALDPQLTLKLFSGETNVTEFWKQSPRCWSHSRSSNHDEEQMVEFLQRGHTGKRNGQRDPVKSIYKVLVGNLGLCKERSEAGRGRGQVC